jgi:hypothetical protein
MFKEKVPQLLLPKGFLRSRSENANKLEVPFPNCHFVVAVSPLNNFERYDLMSPLTFGETEGGNVKQSWEVG